MTTLRIFPLLAALLFSGCASIQQMQNELATSATVPTPSFDRMQATGFASDAKETRVVLDKTSPVFYFDGEKSYYAAFELPPADTPRKLNFKSLFSAPYMGAATVMYPQFVFLNASKQVIGEAKRYRFQLHTGTLNDDFFEGNVIVPAAVRSVVIHTSQRNMPRLEAYSENGQAWEIPAAPSGKLALTLSQPYPANFDFSTAVIRDSIQMPWNDRGDFFYLTQIDGQPVEDSRSVTHRRNIFRGQTMLPYAIDREVPTQRAKYLIVGKTEYALPFQMATNPVYEVKGEIEAALEKNKVYEVRGTLGENYSAVWLEDVSTHTVVGRKIEIRGATRVGVWKW
ncbi:ATPase AAA [Novimethylophilus kurashikiensis]|uniref:ATPase AAA n=1 Tax=Novimethylophilus kurashikiensis TaxID=1825523 RepID=A0A2R5F6Y5_9PROT|nr:MalM family protein [Novimethylophilus kurashikiensis]GBG13599.1 ATPase AAA [Novimethylophilus kurashikiensis]